MKTLLNYTRFFVLTMGLAGLGLGLSTTSAMAMLIIDSGKIDIVLDFLKINKKVKFSIQGQVTQSGANSSYLYTYTLNNTSASSTAVTDQKVNLIISEDPRHVAVHHKGELDATVSGGIGILSYDNSLSNPLPGVDNTNNYFWSKKGVEGLPIVPGQQKVLQFFDVHAPVYQTWGMFTLTAGHRASNVQFGLKKLPVPGVPVPEPASYLILSAGSLMMIIVCCKRKKS